MKKINYFSFLILIMFSNCKSEGPVSKGTSTNEISKIEKGYIGTYTRNEGHVNGIAEGIYSIDINTATGAVSNKRTQAKIINPSFVKKTKDDKFLLAVSELSHEDEPTGFIYSYRIEKDTLSLINRLPTGGLAPCHIEIDNSGQYVFVSNYSGATIAMYQINNEGLLSDFKNYIFEGSGGSDDKQSPHLHTVKVSPDNKLALVADLGTDKIWIFKIDRENHTLVKHSQAFITLQPGAGPRHLAFSKSGDILYVVNELDYTINTINYNPSDESFLTSQIISTIPEGYDGNNSCADLHLHPSGKFLYASNRGDNSIAIFKVDPENGKLTAIGHESTKGKTPRNFAISEDGKFLYVVNQDTNNLVYFTINQETGLLTHTGTSYEVESPVCLEL